MGLADLVAGPGNRRHHYPVRSTRHPRGIGF
jgi:hypothetical protein